MTDNKIYLHDTFADKGIWVEAADIIDIHYFTNCNNLNEVYDHNGIAILINDGGKRVWICETHNSDDIKRRFELSKFTPHLTISEYFNRYNPEINTNTIQSKQQPASK